MSGRMRGTDDVVWLEQHRHTRRRWAPFFWLDIVVGVVIALGLIVGMVWLINRVMGQ